MSISKQITVWCDSCGNWERASTTAAALRKMLRKKGWITIRCDTDAGKPTPFFFNAIPGEVKDFCPKCISDHPEMYKGRRKKG